jgi:HK97 family phage portal protein
MTNFITSWLNTENNSPVVKTGPQSSQPSSYPRKSAAPVNFDSAMTQSAFFAAVRLLSETIAALPLKAFTIDNGTKIPNTDYKLWRLLNFQPNKFQTKNEFFETFMLNLVSNGNAYNQIIRGPTGDIINLIPLMASQTTPTLLSDGTLTYSYKDSNGNVTVFAADKVWHTKLFGNGIVGLSPLSYARQSLGIAIAIDNRVSTLAENGGKTTGILTIDDILTPQQRTEVKQNFKDLESGGNDRLFVLEAGFKYQQTSLSPADMQMLESRRYQVEDIARFLGVPSVLINDTSGTTAWGSGIQQIVAGFEKLNLRPYAERIEASLKRWLMPVSDWEKIEIEFDFDALLRADIDTRTKSAKDRVNSGLLTPNEGRQEEGLPPKDGGDTIYLNGTMVPAGTTRTK